MTVALDFSLLGPALLAGLVVLLTHVPLGLRVLDRGIVFIDLAIAQMAALGVVAAGVCGLEESPWAVQAAALSAALLGAALLTWTERRWPALQEALIGVLFVLASCAGILLLAGNPHGGEHLRDLLVGQVLWVSWSQIGGMALVTLVLMLCARLPWARSALGFYLAFAVAVTASVQLVGVYLVFACLILPALAVRGLQRRMLYGCLLGTGAFLAGLILSAWTDWPSGPLIVLVMALLAALVAGLQSAGSRRGNRSSA